MSFPLFGPDGVGGADLAVGSPAARGVECLGSRCVSKVWRSA